MRFDEFGPSLETHVPWLRNGDGSRKRRPFLLLLGAVGILGLTASACHRSESDLEWISHGGDYDESGFSPAQEIDRNSIGRLGLAWSLDLPGEVALEATPLAVDGMLYFTGSLGDIYGVDAVSGELKWKHEAAVSKHNPGKMRTLFGVNRGAAYLDGRVFSGTLDGRLLAMDAKTGKLLWSVETVDRDNFQTISGAPAAFAGIVLIGNGGGDFGSRGYVTAYDAATGRQLWRFYTVPGDPAKDRGDPTMAMAAKTWGGEWWKFTGGGGTVWNGMTYDPELGRVYIGVGNSGPYNPAVRSPGGGDNLFLASIVALDARTGKYIWHYQVNPREAWDYKATANMIATTLTIDGESRKVLMQAPTNGFFYVIDRTNGKLISAEKIGKVTWADRIDLKTGRPVERPNIRYETGQVDIWPSSIGAHNWQAMSYNPQTGLVYIPYMQIGMRVTLQRDAALGGVSMDPLVVDAEDGKGALLAWDPIAQKARWKVQHPSLWNGGTLTTAGGLVFQGNAEGEFAAYDGETGRKLWRFNAGLGIVAAPISYRIGGKQYVSILVGYGGATPYWSNITDAGWKFGAQPRRLLTFALDGHAKLSPSSPRSFAVNAVDDPKLTLNPGQVKAGAVIYNQRCIFCHGGGLRSSGMTPDLRESQAAMNIEALTTVLHDGALKEAGMPPFEMLTKDDIRDLHMYIRAGAREALGGKGVELQTSGGSHF